MVLHELVHDQVGPGAPIEHIPQDVQLVHRQMLDDLAQPDDVGVRPLVPQDAVDDLAVIQILVVVLEMGVEQLVQNVGAAVGQAFAHVGPGVLAGHQTAQIDELQQSAAVPAVQVGLPGLDLGQFLHGVVDEGGQFRPVVGRHRIPQDQVDLFPDHAGSVVQNVEKGFVFAVQIAHEMLGALGQPEQGFNADDLAGGGRDGGKFFGKQLHVPQLLAAGRQAVGIRHEGPLLLIVCWVYCSTMEGHWAKGKRQVAV